jgi:hypothetical protein
MKCWYTDILRSSYVVPPSISPTLIAANIQLIEPFDNTLGKAEIFTEKGADVFAGT